MENEGEELLLEMSLMISLGEVGLADPPVCGALCFSAVGAVSSPEPLWRNLLVGPFSCGHSRGLYHVISRYQIFSGPCLSWRRSIK